VSRLSNRFVSLCGAALIAGCQSAPHAAQATATPELMTASTTSAPSAASESPAPVPAQAAEQYADALRLMRSGRSAEAEAELQRLAKAYPEFAGPEVNLGLLYLQSSQLVEAEAAFKTALERNPANAVAGNELGITERKMGKFTEAEAAYQRTITADPSYAPTYLNLGVLYDLYLAEPQKALEQFEHYVQLAGENKQVAGWMVELRKRVGVAAPAAKKEPA
jgi:tetratricopeptide (TPR) repeat protein